MEKVTATVHIQKAGLPGTERYLASITSVLCKQNTRVRVIFHVEQANLYKNKVTQHFSKFLSDMHTLTHAHTRLSV